MSAREAAAQNWLAEGRRLLASGKINQARTLFKKALDTVPTYQAAFLVALTYAQQDNTKLASNFFRRATELDPTIAEGYYNLGYSYQVLKVFPSASVAYQEAVRLKPDYHIALHNLGVVHRELGEFDKALACLEKAIEIKPDSIESYYNLGYALLKLERHEEALDALSTVLKHVPNHVKALNNRGLVNMALHRNHDATADFCSAIALDPEDIELRLNKARHAGAINNAELAVSAYRDVLELDKDHEEGLLNLGFNLEKMNNYFESSIIFERLFKKAPNIDFLAGYLHSSRMHYCNWKNYQEAGQRILERVEKGDRAMVPHSVTLLPSTRRQQQQAAEVWSKRIAIAYPTITEQRYRKRRDGKIRVGYFSSDFHGHPVSVLLAPVFELHDREQFEIYAFSMGNATRDAMRLRIEAGVDHFINIRELSDKEVVQRAFEEDLDIAIDLTGFTAGHRVHLYSMGLAPVQISYLGYSATLGAEFMDYIIADPILIPLDHDCDYTEKVIRLPHCYMPADVNREIDPQPMSRAQYGLPEDVPVFCGFNNVYKICPPQFDLWMQILTAAPTSVLWLSSAGDEAKKNLRNEASIRGVDPSRLVFANREERLATHLARHTLADVFLDTLPHNAHATTNDALLAGLPVLTRLGEGFAARVAGSLVTAAGMHDMIMPDAETYVRRAIEIATTPGLSAQLKARLAQNRQTSPLFDLKAYTRDLEKGFLHIHERRLQGLLPAAFDVR